MQSHSWMNFQVPLFFACIFSNISKPYKLYASVELKAYLIQSHFTRVFGESSELSIKKLHVKVSLFNLSRA